MSEHTPGPWIFDPNNTGMTPHAGYGIYDRDFYSGREIVYVLCSTAKERELGEGACEANARLIAAAPDLLDALLASRVPSRFMASLPSRLQAREL